MADISRYLAAIMSAVYGEDVRGSIHDAIKIINDVSEVVLSTGTAITSETSSSEGFFEDSLYLNTDTYQLWRCEGTNSWSVQGSLKGSDGRGITSITKISSVGLVDTYSINYSSGEPTTFTVTNGADGSIWYKGTAISGTGSSITGFPGKEHDFYLNSETGMVYTCTSSGTAVTATWEFVMTISGGGGGGSVVVVDSLASTSTTDALSANQGRVLDNKKINDPVTKTSGDILTYNGSEWEAQAPSADLSLSDLTDTDITSPSANQFLRYDGDDWVNETVDINDATLAIQQNGTNKGTFTANASSNVTVNIVTDDWIETSPAKKIENGSFTFSNLDDTQGWGFKPWVKVTGNSSEKNPTAEITSISNAGTDHMSVTYSTNGDENSEVKLRIVK